ncbi:hypothetical protein ACUL41_15245 [Virgibacillus natechei]
MKEVDEDLASFNNKGDETDVKAIMSQIETAMTNAKASEGKARFADFEGASQGSVLAELKGYNQDKKEEVMEKAKDVKDSTIKGLDKTSSKNVVNKAYQEFKDGDIMYDQYTAIMGSVKNTSGNMSEEKIKEYATESFIEYLEDRGMLEGYLEEHATVAEQVKAKEAKDSALQSQMESSSKEIVNRVYQEYKNGDITFNQYVEVVDATNDLPYMEEPNNFYDQIIDDLLKNVKNTTVTDGISTGLEAGGVQAKNLTELISYHAATWGPNTKNSFVMYSKNASDKSSQIIKGANAFSKVGKFGVPIIGGAIDFFSMTAQGEDVGDAAIKSGAHVGIGIGGAAAGAAVGATLGSIIPIGGTIVGGAIGFASGVVITAVGNTLFDTIYDNREQIYDTITDAGEDIADTVEQGVKSVGNAVSGFVNGLGTVFS